MQRQALCCTAEYASRPRAPPRLTCEQIELATKRARKVQGKTAGAGLPAGRPAGGGVQRGWQGGVWGALMLAHHRARCRQ